jgi:hypothetical protein
MRKEEMALLAPSCSRGKCTWVAPFLDGHLIEEGRDDRPLALSPDSKLGSIGRVERASPLSLLPFPNDTGASRLFLVRIS